jgi:hypothetical protein
MTTFIVVLFYRKSIIHQKDTIQSEDKVIRNKYIHNRRKIVVWVFHCVNFEEPGLLGFCAVWCFQGNVPPSCSGLWVNPWTHNLKMKAVYSFETSGSTYSNTRHNNTEDLLAQYGNGFRRWAILRGNAATIQPYLTYWKPLILCSLLSLSLSLTCYRSNET